MEADFLEASLSVCGAWMPSWEEVQPLSLPEVSGLVVSSRTSVRVEKAPIRNGKSEFSPASAPSMLCDLSESHSVQLLHEETVGGGGNFWPFSP